MMFVSLKYMYSRRSSSLILILAAVTVLISTLPANCEPDEIPEPPTDDQGRSDTLSNEELHKLLGLYEDSKEISKSKTKTTTLKPSFFPTPASNPNRNSENENDKSNSSELIQSLNLLNALLGNPGDSADVSATAAIITAAKTPKPKTTTTTPSTPTVKTGEHDPSSALQSLAILNSLLGLGQTQGQTATVPPTTGSAANLAAAAALLGLGGLSSSHPSVRAAQAQQAAHDHQQASAAVLTNLLLAQAGLALPYAQPLTQAKNAHQQDFQGFTNSHVNLDVAASQQNQLGGLLNLLGTLGSLGQSQPTQSPLASLFNFGQQQIPKQQPDYLSALFGTDGKQNQLDQGTQQQVNSNLLASLLGGGGQQQAQNNLLATLLASGSANSPLSLFGNQSPAPSLLSSLGTIGSSAFQLVGNTLSGLSGTRPNGKPRVRGVDTRLGLGYRMGPNADAQLVWEIGPQIFTDPITNEVKPVVTEKPSAPLQKRFQLPPQAPINLLASGSQNVPRYKQPGFRLSPHPSVVHQINKNSNPNIHNGNNHQQNPHSQHNQQNQQNRPYFRPTPGHPPSDNSNSEEENESPVMLTAYEKWLANNNNNNRRQGQQPRPLQGPPPPQRQLYRRILHYPNVPLRPGMPPPKPVPLFPRPDKSQNRILRVSGNRRPPVFPKPMQQHQYETPYTVQRSGRPQMSMFRPPNGGPAWPSPPSGYNPRHNPWQNFVRDADESFDARNAGTVDPKRENDRAVDVPDSLAASSETDNRRIASIEPWVNPETIMNTLKGGYDRLKFGLLQRTSTTPRSASKEKEEMVPSLFAHLKKGNLIKGEKEEEEDSEENASVVKIGADLSYEQLMESFVGSGGKFQAPKQSPPAKIKFDEKRKLELKPTSDHMKNGATDRPIDPPVEMFIDIENGEVSVRKSIGSIDMNKPWVPTTPKPKSQEEIDDEESQKIFQDVQDHLKASFEQYKFDQELQKATKAHKEKLKAGLDDSMGLVTRYFDLMDATKRKRDVSASVAPKLERVSVAVPSAPALAPKLEPSSSAPASASAPAPAPAPAPISVDTETVSKMFELSKKCNVQPCQKS